MELVFLKVSSNPNTGDLPQLDCARYTGMQQFCCGLVPQRRGVYVSDLEITVYKERSTIIYPHYLGYSRRQRSTLRLKQRNLGQFAKE